MSAARRDSRHAAPPLEHPLSQGDFQAFRDLIHRETGINLADHKRALLVSRLHSRLRALALDSFREYFDMVRSDSAELTEMIDRICTNETHFFREPKQFEFLEHRVFPEWQAAAEAGRRTRRVRVWSAGCSTGEEPYSIAMAFLSRFPPSSGWEIDILATDLSTRVLDRARAAVWPIEKAREIPSHFLSAFMLRGTGSQEGRMKAGPAVRSVVRFQRTNLNAEPFPLSGRFDLVLCRNVLIYFDASSKTRVLGRLLDHLEPHGHLLLGHAESVTGMNDRMRSVGPTVYVHAHQKGRMIRC